jgi:hypothetical protein
MAFARRARRMRWAHERTEQSLYAADLSVVTGPSGTLLSNQTQIRDSKWLLRQRGQKIDVFVLGRFLKLDLSTSTPVETWCPVVGHTKTKVPMVAS